VVANRRVDRHAIHDVAIGLEVGKEPVIVFVARAADGQSKNAAAGVDVVAGRQDQPDIVRVDDVPQGIRNLLLPAVCRMRFDANPEVAHRGKGQGAGRQGRVGIGAKAVVVAPSRLHQCLISRRPVPALAGCPFLAFDEHLVAVLGIGLQPGNPAVIGGFGGSRADHAALTVADFDAGGAIWRGTCTDRILAWGMDVSQILIVNQLGQPVRSGAEVERAPRDEGRLVGHGGQIKVRLGMKLRHRCASSSSLSLSRGGSLA